MQALGALIIIAFLCLFFEAGRALLALAAIVIILAFVATFSPIWVLILAIGMGLPLFVYLNEQ